MKKTVISVIGKDTVGITAKVSAACAEHNVNIIDITQSFLQDMFVMVMLTDISALDCPFNSFSENGNTYIVLDTEDNFMSAREWVWFIDEVNAANAKNLFVFMQTDLSFVSARETKLLKDVL